MAQPRSSFIIKQLDGFGGSFVDSQYLGASYETGKPYVFQNTLMKIFSSTNRFFSGKLLLGMTGGKKMGTVEIDNEVYRWHLQGAEEKIATSLGIVDSANTLPGINNTSFQIWLDLDYYHAPDVLFGEDEDFPLEILDGPTPYGSGYLYTVRIQGDSPDVYFPTYLLEEGQEFDKVWTSVPSEYNDIFGTQQYPNSFMLESQVSAFAQKFTVTDKAWRDQGKLNIDFMYTDPMTKQEKRVETFLPMAEAKMHDALYQSMEAQAWYGKKQTKPGNNDYWVKTGPGIREQLKDSWIEYYNGALTVNRIKDYLLDIFFSRVNEADRKTVAVTGTLGAFMFHDLLAAEASSFLTVDTNFTTKRTDPSLAGRNELMFGAQYTKYHGPEGVELTLVKNPMYDSRRYSKRMHPQYSKYPIDSMRMTFLDFGVSGGENNIKLIKVKDTYRFGYVAGTHTPSGPVKGGQAGSLKAGYDMFTEGTCGIMITDITRCGELIFDYEY